MAEFETLVFFEDGGYRLLGPLSLLRPVFDLRCGIFTLREKAERELQPDLTVLLVRDDLEDLTRERNPEALVNERPKGPAILLNGRAVISNDVTERILDAPEGTSIATADRELVAVKVRDERELARFLPDKGGIPAARPEIIRDSRVMDVPLIRYPWDLLRCNGEQIWADFVRLGRRARYQRSELPGVHILGEDVFLDEGSEVMPGAVLDTRKGPVYVGKGAKVMAGAVLMGPSSVGEGSRIKALARIYPETTVGPMCKVGGEVEGTVFQGFANKQHEGFLGHSYVCEWVNLGAGTENSDLKNNYSTVKVLIDGESVDTGETFVGLFVGDHSKSAVNTTFNTGTTVGVSANLFGSGLTPKFLPSFAWWGGRKAEEYDLEKALETARVVMARRQVELTEAYEKAFRRVFENTSKERQAFFGLSP
jgi:UDP-N-acetylglucosamine diphosphorylase/glucosamine-1-phosphate N-acetyltransferase